MRPSATSVLRRLGAGLAVGATVVGTTAAGMMAASAAVTTTPPDSHYTVSINQGNVPTTAAGFGGHTCDEFGGKAATDDGWLFVASPDNFTSFEAVFDQGTVFYNDPSGQSSAAGTSVAFPKPHEHLAVTTPAGWTLQNAYAVLDGDASFFTLSHTCAATEQPPTTVAAPTASITHSCELGGFQVTLGNTDGTAPADFNVHYDDADHAHSVPAGSTSQFTVPVAEDTSSTLTVSADGLTTQQDTFARDCSQTVPPEQHGVNPAVSFSTACASGITATLSNMKFDDTTTDAVTFTITTPTGAQEQVVVIANQITKRSYAVAEGTTGTISVVAPGLAKQTKSYAKKCTSVLGEKVTKGPKTTHKPAVEGDKAVRLPMTGAPTGAMVEGAVLLLLAGAALSLAGRRRYRPRRALR